MPDIKNSSFFNKISRSNKELRQDRALIIAKGTEKALRRKIEDFNDNLESLKLSLDNLLDINPSNTHTIINPSDFDAAIYIRTAEEIDLKIRDITIRRDLAKARYDQLFES